MTKKDFYRIVLKLLGLYYFITVVIATLFSVFIALFLFFGDSDFWMSLAAFLLSGIPFYLLVFRTDSIIKILRLDKNYDNDIFSIGNLNNVQTFKIGLIILAILLIINNVVEFVSQLFLAFKQSFPDNSLDDIATYLDPYGVDFSILIVAGLKFILGFFILTYLDRLSSKLNQMLKNKIEK